MRGAPELPGRLATIYRRDTMRRFPLLILVIMLLAIAAACSSAAEKVQDLQELTTPTSSGRREYCGSRSADLK